MAINTRLGRMDYYSFKKVSPQEFYDKIGGQNVCPVSKGPWPYETFFKTPSGIVRGFILPKADNTEDYYTLSGEREHYYIRIGGKGKY